MIRAARRLTLKDGRALAYGVLIGADGANSQVARHLFGQSFDRARIGFGLEIEAGGDHVRPDAPIRIDLGAVEWGYGWVFPKAPDDDGGASAGCWHGIRG